MAFVIIAGLGSVAVSSAMFQAVANSGDPLLRRQAMSVAESMLEEVLAQPFTPSASTPAVTASNRRVDHDVDDYNGFGQSGIRTYDDVAVTGLENFSIRVSVVGQSFGSVPSSAAKQVTVTVSGPNGTSVVLRGYKINAYTGI